jgi:hypothetical protein
VELRGIFEANAVERVLVVDAGVVDRELFAVHGFIHDRQHGRALAGDRDGVLDLVFEELADIAALGGSLDGGADVEGAVTDIIGTTGKTLAGR